MLRACIGGLTSLLLFGFAIPTQANVSCGSFAASLSAGELAAIPPKCNSARCLVPLAGADVTPIAAEKPLRRGSSFVYRLASPDTANTLVVLQRKYLAQTGVEVSQNVLVRRERVSFACRGTDAGPVPQIDADRAESAGIYRQLPYDAYETTIRNGYADGSADATFINDHFHVLYRNGSGPDCVSTRDDWRRRGLLLGQHDQVISPVSALFGRVFWFASTPATAAPDSDYSEMRLNVYPVEAETGPRCLRFSVPRDTREVDIDVNDIEKLVGLFPRPPGASVHVKFGAR